MITARKLLFPAVGLAAAVLLVAACEDRAGLADPCAREDPGAARLAVIGTPVPCGGCDDRCYLTRDRPDDLDLAAGDLTVESLVYDPEAYWDDATGSWIGGLVIAGGSSGPSGRYAWISSHQNNVVNKLNMETLRNEGVYRTGREGQSSDPSRTAVDGQGYVYVANRDNSSVTKISGELTRCVERNGIPGIQTSQGETNPATREFDGRTVKMGLLYGPYGSANQDECIIWDVPVGASNATARALAIDARSRLWVGLHSARQYWVLDTETGAILAGPIAVDHAPYGAAIGPDGILWSADTGGYIQAIDTRSATPSAADVRPRVYSGSGNRVYGIAVDGASRVFVSNDDNVSRYDPYDGPGTWLHGTTGAGRGISVDDVGRVFLAGFNMNRIYMHDAETLALLDSWAVVSRPKGCAPDFWGRVWAANNASADVGVVDPADGSVVYIHTYGNNYTYSDFTGFGFAVFTNPTGTFSRLYDDVHCSGHREVVALYYETVTPGTTVVELYARVADTVAGLASAVEVYLGETPPESGRLDLGAALLAAGQDTRAHFLEVRVVMSRNGSESSPVFQSMSLEEYCL